MSRRQVLSHGTGRALRSDRSRPEFSVKSPLARISAECSPRWANIRQPACCCPKRPMRPSLKPNMAACYPNRCSHPTTEPNPSPIRSPLLNCQSGWTKQASRSHNCLHSMHSRNTQRVQQRGQWLGLELLGQQRWQHGQLLISLCWYFHRFRQRLGQSVRQSRLGG